MNYYDDFYNEPSEFEQMIEEFKQSLVKYVKQEHQDWMEFYKKENKELQDVKSGLATMKREHQEKLREYDRKIAEAKSEVRRERLQDILKELQVILFRCVVVYKDKEKCSLCNDNREIEYVTPLGRAAKEKCNCATRLSEYQPSENILCEFREGHHGIVVFYKYNEKNSFTNGYYVLDSYEDSRNPYKVYEVGEYSGEKIDNTYRTYFRSKEDCQKACDVLNKGE